MPILDADELDADPKPVAALSYASLQHRPDVEPPADLTQVRVLALELERRGPSRDSKPGHLTQCRDQFVGKPVAEILLILLRTQIHERKHRRRRRWRVSRWLDPAERHKPAERGKKDRETDGDGAADPPTRWRGQRRGGYGLVHPA